MLVSSRDELLKTCIFVSKILMMKKITFLVLATVFLFVSCNDGDFDVPAFEFTEDVNLCGEYLLYKTSESMTEAIILTLTSTGLSNVPGEKSIEISSTNNVSYRIFSESIGNEYFCQDIPPVDPVIMKELIAHSGTIVIVTEELMNNGVVTGYSYDITISNLLFMDGEERILFETFNFGNLIINS
jgi:hypothetical protein